MIRRIVVEGNQRIEPSTVESYLAIRPGEPYDPQKVDESIKSLFATGLFDDVTIELQGDALVVQGGREPDHQPHRLRGQQAARHQPCWRAEIQLRPRVVYTRARVQNAVNRILELYRRNGRYAAKVEPKIIELDQNRVDLVFEISEGPTTGVGGIALHRQRGSSATAPCAAWSRPSESAWYRFLSTDDTYDPDRLSFDEELLRRFYNARGYRRLPGRLGGGRADARRQGVLHHLHPRGGAAIQVRRDQGRDHAARICGTEQLEALAETSQGRDLRRGPGRGDGPGAAPTRSAGSAMPSSTSSRSCARNPEKLTVDLTYQINEGQKVYVERIDISGNVRTLDKVIRREFRLAEGDAFNTALLRRSQQRLRNLGFFESVDITTEQGSAPDKVVIKTKVVERSTGELSFGAGFSTQDGVLGDIRLTERNLLGQGPGSARQPHRLAAPAADRHQLHRALLPGSRSRRRLRPVPHPAPTSSGSRPTTRPAPAARCASAIR